MKLQSDIVGGSYVQNEDCFKLHLIGVEYSDTYTFLSYVDNNVGLISLLV